MTTTESAPPKSWCGSADDPCLIIWLNTSLAPPIGRVSIGSCPASWLAGWLAGWLADRKKASPSRGIENSQLAYYFTRPPYCGSVACHGLGTRCRSSRAARLRGVSGELCSGALAREVKTHLRPVAVSWFRDVR